MCLFGLAKIGAVAVPVNEQYLADETEYILDTAQVKCAVVEPLYLATYQELVKRGRRFEKGILVARAGQDSPVCDIEYPQCSVVRGGSRRRNRHFTIFGACVAPSSCAARKTSH